MDHIALHRAGQYYRRRRLRRLWKRIVSVLGCFVVFCTTYALMLPAITQERESFCGFESHTHEGDCYAPGTEIESYELTCDYESLNVHSHTAEHCYDEQGQLVCQMLDYVVHMHDASCYDEEGFCRCPLPVIAPHEHNEDCYLIEGGHTHGEGCYAVSIGALVCSQEEITGHIHSGSCWVQGDVLLCNVENGHLHGEACYAPTVYECGYAQEHTHSAACYTTGALLCSQEENHQHTEACYPAEQIFTCGYEQEHRHTANCTTPGDELICSIAEHIHEDCFATPDPVCKKSENHVHDDLCYEQLLQCEIEEHHHTDACIISGELVCTVPENHEHSVSCYNRVLACSEPESDGHLHTEECYEQQSVCICPLQEEPGVMTLNCAHPAETVHVHSESCFEAFYHLVMNCALPEHVHTLECFSDPNADVETSQDWRKTLSHITLSGIREADVLEIARSQLGYRESSRNYLVLEDGETTHGYTRYGAWYGAPYGDWCAMFVSFCLHHAQVEDMPLEAHCQRWIYALSAPEVDLYRAANVYQPKPGDLIFFDWDEDEQSDHVGLVEEITDVIKTIEGNSANCVRNVTYELDDARIMGYGLIPQIFNQEFVEETTPEQNTPVYDCIWDEHIHGETCVDENGELICTIAEHMHAETCQIEAEPELPEEKIYFCGLEEHAHCETCVDENGELFCTIAEHAHTETCQIEAEPELPEEIIYYCGMEEHVHAETCADENGALICILAEHAHTETCQIEAEPELPEEIVYYCGLEEHAHGETCVDENGVLICAIVEHTHIEACQTEAESELPEEILYYCGLEEHAHGETCADENGVLICAIVEHTHIESCLIESESKLPAELLYYCGLEEHTHSELCVDENGGLICLFTEHIHDECCLAELLPEETFTYFCGLEEHAHSENCVDENGVLICVLAEHVHTEVCEIDRSDFTQDILLQVQEVSQLIDALPSADDIDEKIFEYDSIGDEAAMEQWLTTIYLQVQEAYRRYAVLPVNAQLLIENRDKLLELEYIWAMMPLVDTVVGYTANYSTNLLSSGASFVFYTQASNGQYYAIDGRGNAVAVTISANGEIIANVNDRSSLLWTISGTGNNTLIYSSSSNRYMHAYYNGANDTGVTTSGRYTSTPVAANEGVRFRGNSQYAYLDENSLTFRVTSNENQGAVYRVGVLNENYVWLDGTNGGLMSLAGSPDKAYMISGAGFYLPETWESPSKYSYRLRGWYDVINDRYYAPGAYVEVTEHMVFYADWVAASYNIGQYNRYSAPTISTKEFITTRVFDYSSMFNTLSTTASVNVSPTSHSETWTMNYDNGSPGFIFRDWDVGSQDLSYPANLTDVNNNGEVNSGLYSAARANLLFGTSNSFNPATGSGVMGKQYLGTADHLFQYGNDPSDPEYYGYYYFDSHLNAASYNRDHGRFYVYDYLERTSDSEVSHSDFLPFNSPYANTNGHTVPTYSYAGARGEYSGTTHYMYDAKYSGNGSDPSHVATNYWFGMSTELKFYLPNVPGSRDASGMPANQSIHGHDMVFEFSGDDDVWVLVDGQLVLDLGGIHGDEAGSINFTTGEVLVNGQRSGNVTYIQPGEHTLTIYYLERGSSMSNCKIRFNLSPRYQLTLQKEDVLTRELLNGAQFSIYTDAECTVPAQLWTSKSSHDRGDKAGNVFTVTNGKALVWGLAAGHTYYIKETKPPADRTETVHGVVVVTLNNTGDATYAVMADHGELTGGFTVHGYRIDQENQQANMVITNGINVTETTDVYVSKRWNDGLDHSGDSITVYLLVDGKRIREVTLSDANNWQYTWPNMPKYYEDGVTEVVYEVQEGTVPGYISRVEPLNESNVHTAQWVEAAGLKNGGTYLMRSYQGYMAASGGWLYFVADEAQAAASNDCLWVATVHSNGQVTLRNKSGQTLYYSPYRFRAGSNPNGTTSLTYENHIFRTGSTYMCNLADDNSGTINAWEPEGAVEYIPYQKSEYVENLPEGGTGFRISNTPIGEEATMSLTVFKEWELGQLGTSAMYEQLTVNVELMENGKPSGMTAQLNLRNGWQAIFQHLPITDHDGRRIEYTVVEQAIDGPWSPSYGEIIKVEGVENTYVTTITNTNTLVYMLPETGGGGTCGYTAGGLALVVAAMSLFVYKKRSKCREEDAKST